MQKKLKTVEDNKYQNRNGGKCHEMGEKWPEMVKK